MVSWRAPANCAPLLVSQIALFLSAPLLSPLPSPPLPFGSVSSVPVGALRLRGARGGSMRGTWGIYANVVMCTSISDSDAQRPPELSRWLITAECIPSLV